jgi:hypothetical protein
VTCIEGIRCVYICPDQAIQIDERMEGVYEEFIAPFHLTEEMMEAKKSKIITDLGHTAA